MGGLLHPVDSDTGDTMMMSLYFALDSFLLWRRGDHLNQDKLDHFPFTNARASRFAPGDSLMLTANRRAAEFKATNGESCQI